MAPKSKKSLNAEIKKTLIKPLRIIGSELAKNTVWFTDADDSLNHCASALMDLNTEISKLMRTLRSFNSNLSNVPASAPRSVHFTVVASAINDLMTKVTALNKAAGKNIGIYDLSENCGDFSLDAEALLVLARAIRKDLNKVLAML